MKDAHVLEWSQKTNNFHIQPLSSVFATNQTAFIDDKKTPDYIIIMVGTLDVIHTMADSWRKKLTERSYSMPVKAVL